MKTLKTRSHAQSEFPITWKTLIHSPYTHFSPSSKFCNAWMVLGYLHTVEFLRDSDLVEDFSASTVIVERRRPPLTLSSNSALGYLMSDCCNFEVEIRQRPTRMIIHNPRISVHHVDQIQAVFYIPCI